MTGALPVSSDRFVHPTYGRPASKKIVVVGGYVFRPYGKGITLQAEWVTDCGRIVSVRRSGDDGYASIVDGIWLKPCYTSIEEAMSAGAVTADRRATPSERASRRTHRR